MKSIVLAGGCFWGVEAYFKLVDGVKETTVGYIDGKFPKPSYEMVCSGSGHAEAVWIEYDTDSLTLGKLLQHFFNIVDPTLFNRQGPDVGVQYRTGIYNYSDDELSVINNTLAEVATNYKKPLQVDLKNNLPFYQAEPYHQDYLDKNANGYCHINLTSVKNIK